MFRSNVELEYAGEEWSFMKRMNRTGEVTEP